MSNLEEILEDPARLASLRAIGLLDTPPDAAFDRYTRLASKIIHTPVALISLVDSDRQFFKSQFGLAEPWASQQQSPLSHSYCKYVVSTGSPLLIEDARQNPLLSDSPAIHDMDAIAYAGIPLRSNDGFVMGSFCVLDSQPRVWTADEIETLKDITAAVSTEIELRQLLELQQSTLKQVAEAEERYRTMISVLGEGVFIQHSDGAIQDVNASAERILGLSADQLMGKEPIDPRWVTIHEDGDPFPAEEQPPAVTLKTGVPQSNVIMGVKKPDGKSRWVSITTRPIVYPHNTHQKSVVVSLTDVTERIDLENVFLTHIDQLGTLRKVDTSLTASLDVRYALSTSLNEAMNLSGADSGYIALLENGENGEDVLQVTDYRGAYPWADHAPILNPHVGMVSRVLSTFRPVLVAPVWSENEDDQFLPSTQAQMIFPLVTYDRCLGIMTLESNKLDRFTTENFDFMRLVVSRMSTAIDNSLLYKTSQQRFDELQIVYSKVSDLEQLKSDMIRIASHDLKNPIGKILAYLELFKEDLWSDLSEVHRDFINEIGKSTNRMLQITNDILSLERIESATSTQPFDFSHLLESVITDYIDSAQEKGIAVPVSITTAPLIVDGDETQLREAIANLITNAVKYTPEQGTITIRAEAKDHYAVFTVQDTGYGIPANLQDRLFQPFYRATSEQTLGIEGTGLGLHLVKNIVDRHSGTILFHSEYGKGSLFGFELPLYSPTTTRRMGTAPLTAPTSSPGYDQSFRQSAD